jgi:hypothetical protein
MQIIGRQMLFVTMPRKQTDFLAIVPDIVYGKRHPEDMLV